VNNHSSTVGNVKEPKLVMVSMPKLTPCGLIITPTPIISSTQKISLMPINTTISLPNVISMMMDLLTNVKCSLVSKTLKTIGEPSTVLLNSD
jgi:hypothetical protein